MDGEWTKVVGGGETGLTPEDAITDLTAFIATAPSDGDYYIKPSGYLGDPIRTYVNYSQAPGATAYIQIARGRESTNWWNTAGQNYATEALTSTYLNSNTPISVAPNDFCNALVGNSWQNSRFYVTGEIVVIPGILELPLHLLVGHISNRVHLV